MAKQVLNHDIVGLIQRLDRYKEEILLSVSSNCSELSAFDRERFMRNLGSMRSYINWITNEPLLDLVETSPKFFEVAEVEEAPVVESEVVNDICRIFSILREEILNSQSARRSSSLVIFDLQRVNSLIQKLENFIIEYCDAITPLDLPESSPRAAISGEGRKGI